LHHEGLNRNKYRRDHIPVWLQQMDHFTAFGGDDTVLFPGFEKFTSGSLNDAMKNGYQRPPHPFFERCEDLKAKQKRLEEGFAQRLLGLKRGLLEYLPEELAARKQKKNIQSFNDLLTTLHHALSDEGGEELAKSIRAKFTAALIDEFQDTDPIQYAIFRTIFHAPESILFLIGDPKQAIYGFRGADIFSYLEAARHAETRYTLGENWRTNPDLITAVNSVFTGMEYPFLYEEIPFYPAVPAKGGGPESLKLEGEPKEPLQLWFIDADTLAKPGKPIAKARAREVISRAVAAEISRLLGPGTVFVGDRPLRPNDIAVLARKNAETILIQKALSELNIPSVLYSLGNLFDSYEALEVERMLSSLVDVQDEKLLRGALATAMIGITGEELEHLIENESAWEQWIVRFNTYHSLWKERGFVVMFRHFLSELRVLPRVMSLPDGERRATNILHLLEVLHQASVERTSGMAGLVRWLSAQRNPKTPRLEEHQLRLESDEKAVKILTVHKSKGLEYPVVFSPFLWDGSRLSERAGPFTFHDDQEGMRLTVDLGSPEREKNVVAAERELLAENLRLLYVGLTRAKSRCYLVWGRIKDCETSAPAYLLHGPRSGGVEDAVAITGERVATLDHDDMVGELTMIQRRSRGTMRLAEIPLDAGRHFSPPQRQEQQLRRRKYSGIIDCSWQVTSFSALLSGSAFRGKRPDRDAICRSVDGTNRVIEEVSAGDDPAGVFAFPRGIRAGSCLHGILEHFDFQEEDVSFLQKMVADKLKEYGFEHMWEGAVCRMIRNVVSTPLDEHRKDLRLASISWRDRLNELEFYFPLRLITSKKLQDLFARFGGFKPATDFSEHLERLYFGQVKGFVKGFIDMVFRFEGRFYLVDWKSNFLGNRVDDYDEAGLAVVMNQEFYILQYHLYALALDQYLRARIKGYDYEEHFGGVYYIFLRGVDPARGSRYGIYRDKPAGELIAALSDNLLDRTKVQ
ncbi:MAG: exodeoxyribonuclease V subunit beta, partial [Deltaproteobacteria bacterium]|nr:exodeoxyribonuclease V subunit beta [Deltaproteobacteria bacterium]